jgi:hypothetical protein
MRSFDEGRRNRTIPPTFEPAAVAMVSHHNKLSANTLGRIGDLFDWIAK